MQNYTEIAESKTLKESRELLLNNDKTAMSNNAGTSFPTENLQEGMSCYRTDEGKLYYYNGSAWKLAVDVSGSSAYVATAGSANSCTTATTAGKLSAGAGSATQPAYINSSGVAAACTYSLGKSVPSDAKFTDTTYSTATTSSAGLMSASDKTKLDGLSDTSGIDVGMIIPFASNGTIPTGFLLCNGAAVGRTTYPDLFSAIGTTYGSGNGSTTFNLPNLTDKFIEGSGTAGTSKSAGLPNISGNISVVSNGNNTTADGAFSYTTTGLNPSVSGGAAGVGAKASFSASRSTSIYGNSSTVQPPALTMRYIIKAFAGASADSTDVAITKVANDLTVTDAKVNNLVTITESKYNPDGSWYRVWSDGWIEQGGYKVDWASGDTLTFSKAFANIPLTFQISQVQRDNKSWETGGVIQCKNPTTTSIMVGLSTNGEDYMWYACGK